MFRWIKSLLEPHSPEDRRLYRCSCGSLLWSNSPQEIRRQHTGHQMRMAHNSSVWEFFKMKMGWIK